MVIFKVLLASRLRIGNLTGILAQELISVLEWLDPPYDPAKEDVFTSELGQARSQLCDPPFDKPKIAGKTYTGFSFQVSLGTSATSTKGGIPVVRPGADTSLQ